MTTYDDVFEIPANTILVMGPKLYQIFVMAGCIPRCHSCLQWIDEGAKFQLIEAEGKDRMVCDKTIRGWAWQLPGGKAGSDAGAKGVDVYCGSRELLLKRIEERKPRPRVGGGFSRPSHRFGKRS